MPVINNSFKKNQYIEIQTKMARAMNSRNEYSNYSFRQAQWRYLFAIWNPPYTGRFERWAVNDQDDWAPKLQNSHSNTNPTQILFDLKIWNEKNPEKYFLNLVFSKNQEYLGVIWSYEGKAYLDVFSFTKNTMVLEMLKVSMDGDILISNTGVYYCNEIDGKWPNQIFFHPYAKDDATLIYKESDNRCKLSLQEMPGGSIFFMSRSLTGAKCWKFSTKGRQAVFASAIEDGEQLLSVFTVTDNQKNYFGACHKIGKERYRIDLYSDSEERTSKILVNSEIHSVDGVSDCLVFEFFDCGRRKSAYIKLSDLLLGENTAKFTNMMNTLGENVRIYQNNFTPQKFYFLQSDQINHETLQEVNTNKKTITHISKNKITSFQLSNNKMHVCHTQINALSRDKHTHIPISLFWQGTESSKLPLKQKTIVYVYGAYGKDELGYSLSSMILGFIDAGFVFAVAHVRGGGYYGGDWYRLGKLLNKWNSINDFIDCCEELLTQNISGENSLAAFTTSAGGVIVGATINKLPNLLSAALLFSPFIDPYDMMMGLKKPVAKREVMEWGNAQESSMMKNYIRSYSPLQNVSHDFSLKKTYIMAICGGKDYLVSNADTKRWINRLNTAGYDSHFELNTHSGHGGGSIKDADLILQQVTKFLSRV